ncbi:MAG: TIGR03564 family F420-dependent LLM class oxidoreductase [Chloroflexi bacterium]|nr:TIGR03564 family F420-dependent LLM class oxidoreductase [Chloroflexota bacterium]
MDIGITVGLGARGEASVEGLIDRAGEVEHRGFRSLWMPTAFGFDALTVLAVVGSRTNRLEVGTAVVPTFPRHPVVMAQQALTTQAVLGGRFTLGIGLSHKVMMEDQLGIPYERPAEHMREYLSVLAPLLRGEAVSFHGSQYRVETTLTIPGSTRVPLLVAALGPAMLGLAGTLADGTITSWVGPRTLERHVVPLIRAAAAEAGRPAPRVAVGLPIVLTADAAEARRQISERAAWYTTLPSYRAMFEREGATQPGEVALVGTEGELDAALDRLREAGATDFLAQIQSTGPGTAAATFEYLASRANRAGA